MKYIASFLTLTVLMWLMPLGAFIKPAQEKTACGGARAFHMCTMMDPSANPNSSKTVSMGSDFGVQKEQTSQNSSYSNHLFLESALTNSIEREGFLYSPVFYTPNSHIISPLDIPPRLIS